MHDRGLPKRFEPGRLFTSSAALTSATVSSEHASLAAANTAVAGTRRAPAARPASKANKTMRGLSMIRTAAILHPCRGLLSHPHERQNNRRMFSDLISRLLAALPVYGRQLIALVVAPKTTMLQQDLDSESALRDAMTFLAVSFGIAFIAELPLLAEGKNKELVFGVLAISSALAFAWNVAFLALAWKMVGAKLSMKKVIVATSYFSGVSTLIFLSFYLIAAGTLRILDPVAYEQMIATGAADAGNAAIAVFLTIV